MKTRKNLKFSDQVSAYIEKLPDKAILRQQLNHLGSSRQISRALNALIAEGKLIRIGYGVYSKAYKSPYGGVVVLSNSFSEVCMEALNKLGVQWEPGKAIQDYNSGRSQQVPVRYVVRLKSRYRGHFTYGGRKLLFEKNINAR